MFNATTQRARMSHLRSMAHYRRALAWAKAQTDKGDMWLDIQIRRNRFFEERARLRSVGK